MKSKIMSILGGTFGAIAAVASLNACSGENGVDGVNGKDGVDGKDGQDGVSVTDTLYVFQKDTVIFAGDTIYVSQKDTVLVKDTVYIANGGSGSGNGGAGTGGSTPLGTLVDERDGQTYRTTKIGDQVWMAENLNFPVEGSYCYGNTLVNCETYGRLYTWESAQDVCPSGWHLPSKEEFETLLENVGENSGERKENLAARSWGFGTDPYGFSALPAGDFFPFGKTFYGVGDCAIFLSSTVCGIFHVYLLRIDDDGAYVYDSDKDFDYSVRCLQD